MVFTVIGAIIIFSLIIFIHEFGHFISARIFGVTVHEFAIGMGPAIWKKQSKESVKVSEKKGGFFYVIFVLQSEGKLFIMKGVVITGKKEDWYDQHCDCRR